MEGEWVGGRGRRCRAHRPSRLAPLATRGGDHDTWRGILGRIAFLHRFHATRAVDAAEGGSKKIISINLDTFFRRCIVSRSHEVVGKKWRGCQVPNLDSMRLQKETGRTGEKGDRTVSDLMVSCV